MTIAVVIGKIFFPRSYDTGQALYYALHTSLIELGAASSYMETLEGVDDSFDLAIILPHTFHPNEIEQLKKRLQRCRLVSCVYDPLPLGEEEQFVDIPYLQGFWKTFQQYAPFFDGVMDLGEGGARFLKHRGYNAAHLQLGYHAHFENPAVEKDIDVSFLGETESRARRRLFKHFKRHLQCKTLFDNSSKSNFEAYRRDIARSKMTLNIRVIREYSLFTSVRVVLFAMTNKTLVLTQNSLFMEDYKNGEHLVICNDHYQFIDRINYYLAHEDERLKIVNNAYNLIQRRSFCIGLANALQKVAKNFEIRL